MAPFSIGSNKMLPFRLFLFPLIGLSFGGSTTGKPLARNKVIRSSTMTFMWLQVKSPRLLDSGTPEARSSLVKTKVTAENFQICHLYKWPITNTDTNTNTNGQQQVLVRKGKGPTWASASTYPAYLASQVETAAGERKLDQVSRCKMVLAL